MQVTAEIRWFWRDDGSRAPIEWFVSTGVHGAPPAVPASRCDRYLVDVQQSELGIKSRGGRAGIEVKGLVSARAGMVTHSPFDGPIEIWSKWATPVLDLAADRTTAIEKQRWQRAFDATGETLTEVSELIPAWFRGTAEVPSRGCNVEVTRVVAPGDDVWWTLGFEAYGELATVAADLIATAEVMARRKPPVFAGAICQSYPAWLGKLCSL